MGCYIVPAVLAVVFAVFKNKISIVDKKYLSWLNLLYFGGAVFGIVDHAWNNELFVFSVKDFFLGILIVLSITLSWLIFILYDKYFINYLSKSKELT